MFFITCEAPASGLLTAGAGESLEQAWENLEEMLSAQGENMPHPDEAGYFEGKPLNVTHEMTFKIEK